MLNPWKVGGEVAVTHVWLHVFPCLTWECCLQRCFLAYMLIVVELFFHYQCQSHNRLFFLTNLCSMQLRCSRLPVSSVGGIPSHVTVYGHGPKKLKTIFCNVCTMQCVNRRATIWLVPVTWHVTWQTDHSNIFFCCFSMTAHDKVPLVNIPCLLLLNLNLIHSLRC